MQNPLAIRWPLGCTSPCEGNPEAMTMSFLQGRVPAITLVGVAAAFWFTAQATAQEAPVLSRDTIQPETSDAQNEGHPVDGHRHGLPVEAFAVVPGTRFLVRLEGDLSSKELHKNQEFRVRTLEPLEAGQGNYLPAGAIIVGHISRVESAGSVGRAKVWLMFDDIQTRFGKLPIVAEVASVPGDHSLKTGPLQGGVIEGRGSTQKDAAQAAAAGSAMGALRGVKDRNKREIEEGAALGALEAYLMEVGRGQEIDLPRGTKLELELERALYLLKD
jgi:hypothetical protein